VTGRFDLERAIDENPLDLIARPNSDLVPHGFGYYDLAFWTDLHSHTSKYN
jgi:hypothetical protein